MTVDVQGSIHNALTGRYAGHVQVEGDAESILATAAPLSEVELRQAAVMEALVSNERFPFGYMQRFEGGNGHEMAAMAVVLGDTDLYGGRQFTVTSTESGALITTPVLGGGILAEEVEAGPVADRTRRDAGLLATRHYADELDFKMSRMHSFLSAVESGPAGPPNVPFTAKVLPLAPGPGCEEFLGPDGQSFKLAFTPEDVPAECYEVAFRTDKPLSDERMQQFAQLAGYAWRSSVNGESLGRPRRIDANTFAVAADSTKGNGTTWDFFSKLPEIVANGSPVRKTDRSGEGTKGTRLTEGLNTDRFDTYFS